jgi:hypothetical protein
MPQFLSGPGVGLAFPTNLYPSELTNAPLDSPGNQLGMAPGDVLVLPAGDWYISLGFYLVLQFLDPVTNVWQMASSSAYHRGTLHASSDGFNCRIANLPGCVVSASVVNGGTNYVQATTTITAIGGFTGASPTLLPIVGGALKISGGTLTANGAGYGVPPIVMIPPPPPAQVNANGVGGIPAAAIAIIASGTVSSISMINQGAGYPTAPVAVIVPSPFDPNLSTGITAATVTFTLGSAGVIMGALVTNSGSPLPNGSLASVTLSVGGAGTSGSLTANVLQTVVSSSVTGAGSGGSAYVTTSGGVPVAGIGNSPSAEGIAWLPRPAQISSSATANSAGTIYDGGLFEAAPAAAVVAGIGATSTIATVALTMGSFYDIAVIQPAP